MENSESLLGVLAKSLPMNPLISALVTHPAVADASRRALAELIPVVEKSLKGVRAGRWLAAASPVVLTSCFAAGVMVGWLTAPEKGADLRAHAKERFRRVWAQAGSRARAGKLFLTRRLGRPSETGDVGPSVVDTHGAASPN